MLKRFNIIIDKFLLFFVRNKFSHFGKSRIVFPFKTKNEHMISIGDGTIIHKYGWIQGQVAINVNYKEISQTVTIGNNCYIGHFSHIIGSKLIRIEDSVLIAELVNVSPDPLKQLIMIDKGEKDGVYIGQAVIDAYGLVGQVVEVNAIQSTVILISDSRHALPVQINRNGVLAIAEGSGRIDTLWLPNLVSTTDIQVGDLMVSSGLGRRFPIGYPVGVVETVKRDPGQAFLEVAVRPSAELDRSRFVLLVFAGEASL